jgi:hypothetical protein
VGETKLESVEIGKLDPELAAAIVAAHAEVESLHRDGKGQHGAYTSSDEVAFVARKALTKHGATWLRVGVDLGPCALEQCELGNQAYVGDAIEHGMILHKNGSFVIGSTRMPVIASKGRPHDKATGASLTYDAGHTLRGLMCLDREDKNHAVDRREDIDDGAPQPPRPPSNPKPPAANGKPSAADNLNKLREAVEERVERFRIEKEIATTRQAWAEACSVAGFDDPIGNGKGPYGCGFEPLGKIDRALKKVLGDE